MVATRFLTAGVVIAVLLPAVLLGGIWGIVGLVFFFGGTALWELTRNLSALKTRGTAALTVGLGLLVPAGFALLPIPGVLGVAACLPLIVVLVHLALYSRLDRTLESAPQMVFALGYAMLPLAHAVLIRRLEHGAALIVLTLLIICLGDAGAFFAGRRFGSHRLAPTVSPSKTWEGFAGGLAGGLAGAALMKIISPDCLSFKAMLILAVILSVAGPIGDLAASSLKRRLGIKDFGSLLPGHGGVLDRADSLITGFPAAYYFLVLGGFSVLQ
jgi:phosphatidate cytidylyltransferase